MKLVNNYCNKLASTLDLTEEQQEIIIFGAESAISTLYSFCLTLILSLLLNVVPIMLMVFLPFAIVKSFAGGTHCKSMTNCAVFSALSFSLSAKLIEQFPYFFSAYERYILILVISISMIFYILWAPAEVPEKPISQGYRKILRIRTFICFSVLTIIISLIHLRQLPYAYPFVSASCVGIMMQSLAITPLGYKLMDNIDFILTRILQRR